MNEGGGGARETASLGMRPNEHDGCTDVIASHSAIATSPRHHRFATTTNDEENPFSAPRSS